MNSKMTQTEYIPLAEPILVNVINDHKNEEQMMKKKIVGVVVGLTIWYIFMFFIGMILFTNIFR